MRYVDLVRQEIIDKQLAWFILKYCPYYYLDPIVTSSHIKF